MTDMVLQKPESLSLLVARHLKQAIVEARLKLGEALSEDKIATTLNVSRTPVREALNILRMQGLIDILPQKGSFVFLPSKQDIAALAEFRLMLERQGAALALARAPALTLKDMQKALRAMKKASASKDPVAYARADDLFHMAVFDHCENAYLKDAYNAVAGRIAALRCHLSGPLKLYQNQTFGEHREIAAALAAGDLRLLQSRIGQHITGMQANYIAAIEDGLLQVPNVRPRSKGPRQRPAEDADTGQL